VQVGEEGEETLHGLERSVTERVVHFHTHGRVNKVHRVLVLEATEGKHSGLVVERVDARGDALLCHSHRADGIEVRLGFLHKPFR